MTRRISFPLFGSAADKYNQYQEMQQQQSYNLLLRALKSAGEQRATNIVLTNLQEGDAGLEPGSLYVIGNRLFISKLNIAHPLGVSAATSVGSVTVIIS